MLCARGAFGVSADRLHLRRLWSIARALRKGMRTTEAATTASVLARKARAAHKRLPPLTAAERLAIIAFFRTDDCPDIYEQRKTKMLNTKANLR